MTKTLYVQTDTTGRYLFRQQPDDPNQPHLIRLAMLVANDDRLVSRWCGVVRPTTADWRLEPDATIAHGVTPEYAQQHGLPLSYVVGRFMAALESVDRVCAFNADFHQKVLQRSAYECHIDWQTLFSDKQIACAMRNATDIVRKPRVAPGGGYSWPKLWEAYEFFTGEELPPVDIDPVERGATLVEAVYKIDEGIRSHQRSVAHE